MEKQHLEPGLLTVFRLFTGLRLALAIVFTLARLAAPDKSIHSFELIEPALLMTSLSILAWRTKYERVLLPVALVIAGIGPLISQAEFLSDDNALVLPIESILTLHTWSSMIVLLLPVIIIAWQYRFQQVVMV